MATMNVKMEWSMKKKIHSFLIFSKIFFQHQNEMTSKLRLKKNSIVDGLKDRRNRFKGERPYTKYSNVSTVILLFPEHALLINYSIKMARNSQSTLPKTELLTKSTSNIVCSASHVLQFK